MSFKDDVKKYVDIGVSASKDALSKAGNAVSKFGDESVVRLEKHKMESLLKQELLDLGSDVVRLIEEEKKDSVSSADSCINERLEKIRELKSEIARREEILRKK